MIAITETTTAIIKTYTLDNIWRVTFQPENLDDDDVPYNFRIDIESSNGGIFEHQISGQVKRDECCDWGFNRHVMLHFCGGKDSTILQVVFDEAMKMFNAE